MAHDGVFQYVGFICAVRDSFTLVRGLSLYRPPFRVYKALFRIRRALFRIYRALFRIHRDMCVPWLMHIRDVTPWYVCHHTATHCNTMQHTATHCNTLQRAIYATRLLGTCAMMRASMCHGTRVLICRPPFRILTMGWLQLVGSIKL